MVLIFEFLADEEFVQNYENCQLEFSFHCVFWYTDHFTSFTFFYHCGSGCHSSTMNHEIQI